MRVRAGGRENGESVNQASAAYQGLQSKNSAPQWLSRSGLARIRMKGRGEAESLNLSKTFELLKISLAMEVSS
jgi:hypothetical protein